MSTITSGRCRCGAIRFAYKGAPRWVAHCHCESCRRATSSAFATYVGVEATNFGYLSGEELLERYSSSPGVVRSFCSRCGSPLTFVGEKWADEVHIYAGALDEPGAVTPKAHVNFAEALPWADIHDDLPRFARFAADGPPIRRGPAT